MKRQFHHCNAWIDTVDFQGDKAEILLLRNTYLRNQKYISFDMRPCIDLYINKYALDYSRTTTKQLGRYLGETLGLNSKYLPANKTRAIIDIGEMVWYTNDNHAIFHRGTLDDFWRVYRG